MASEFNDISDLIQKGMKVEAIEKLLDLREMMANIRDENLALKVDVKRLESSLEEKTQLTYEAPFYWAIEEGVHKEGPFCQKCFDSDTKKIRLQTNGNDYWVCKVCTSNYRGKEFKARKTRRASSVNAHWLGN